MTLESKIADLIKAHSATEEGFNAAISQLQTKLTKIILDKAEETKTFASKEVEKVRADFERLVVGVPHELRDLLIPDVAQVEVFASELIGASSMNLKNVGAPESLVIFDSIVSPRFIFKASFEAAPTSEIAPSNGGRDLNIIVTMDFQAIDLPIAKSYRGISTSRITADFYVQNSPGQALTLYKTESFDATTTLYFDIKSGPEAIWFALDIDGWATLNKEFIQLQKPVALDVREIQLDMYSSPSAPGSNFPLRRVR